MIEFYFQYDRDRKKAKVVLNPGTDDIQILYADTLVCEVPTKSKIQNDSPQFAMYGKCATVWHSFKRITLTDEKDL